MSQQKTPLDYQRTVLYRTTEFEIISIDWSQTSASEFHDHGWSQCSVLIQEGSFRNTLRLGLKTEVQVLEAGQVINTPVGAQHKLECLSPKGKTLHVYTPPIAEQAKENNFNSNSAAALKDRLQLSESITIDSLKSLMQEIKSASISTHSPFFMNQLFSGVTPQLLLAEEVIAKTKTTLATQEASPIFSAIEEEVIRQLGQLIGWPEKQRHGISVPGGSAANFMAVHCARQRVLPESKKLGLSGQKFKVYVSSEAHYSLKKACVVLGLGLDSLTSIPPDANGKMQVEALRDQIAKDKKNNFLPLLVCATAGTTVLGSFDPISEISDICKEENIWLHVDAAWGGPALFTKRLHHLISGVHNADSVTFDGHKLFGANLTSSFFLTRHEKILFDANDVTDGDYLFHENSPDRGRLSWQCGRRAEAFSFWTIWKSNGTQGLGQFVDRLLEVRNQAVRWIQEQPGLQLVGEPEYLNICVRIRSPHSRNDSTWSTYVRKQLIENNFAMVNYSSDQEGSFLRLILAHPYIEFSHVKAILEQALQIK